ncbi:MAG: LysR family transcriptional regulator [Spirosomataceae bacterium]
MEIRQLKYFVMIAEEQHYSRAADRLYVSQPALSQQIRLLEDSLHTELFSRQKRTQNRKVELTEAGALLYPVAKQILQSVQQVSEQIQGLNRQKKVIRLGIYKMLVKERIAEVLPHFAPYLSEVDIRLVEFPTFWHVQQALVTEQIDLGITLFPLRHPELEGISLAQAHLDIALPAGHPLAAYPSVSLQDLTNENWIEMERSGHPIYQEIEDFCLSQGYDRTPHIVQEVSSLDLLCNLVSLAMGVAFIPTFYDTSRFPKIIRRPLQYPTTPLEIHQGLMYKTTHDFPFRKELLQSFERGE